jgi:hypothetical protein
VADTDDYYAYCRKKNKDREEILVTIQKPRSKCLLSTTSSNRSNTIQKDDFSTPIRKSAYIKEFTVDSSSSSKQKQ